MNILRGSDWGMIICRGLDCGMLYHVDCMLKEYQITVR
jgi:hypothetical protein